MSAEDFKKLGNAAVSAGNYNEAIEHYSNAIELDDNNHIYFTNRSMCYGKLNNWKQSLADAEQATKLNPQWPKGFYRAALAQIELGLLPEALTNLQKATQLDPATYQQEMIHLQHTIRQKQQQEMMNPFGGDIIAKLAKHKITKSLSEQPSIRDALLDIQKNPQNIQRYTDNQGVMVCLQALMGISPEEQHRQAQEEFEREERRKAQEEKEAMKPTFVAPTMQRDTTKVEEPQEEEYVDEELLKEKKERAERRAQADKIKEEGGAMYKAKKFDEAISLFKKAIEIDDTSPVYYMNIAACYFEQQKYQECIDTCQSALQISGITANQKSKTYARMANAQCKLNQFEVGIQTYKRAIMEDTNPTARQALKQAEKDFKEYKITQYYDDEKSDLAKNEGNAAYSAGQYAKAIELYTDAIARNPNNWKVYSNRAAAYIKVAAWEKGLEDCNKCLSFEPKFVKALLRKGKILHFLKSYSAAMEVFNEALEIAPHDPEIEEAILTTQRAIYSTQADSTPEQDEARVQAALRNDPSLAMALQSPQVQRLLQDMQTDPMKAMEAMQDPTTGPLLQKLIAAGIIRLG